MSDAALAVERSAEELVWPWLTAVAPGDHYGGDVWKGPLGRSGHADNRPWPKEPKSIAPQAISASAATVESLGDRPLGHLAEAKESARHASAARVPGLGTRLRPCRMLSMHSLQPTYTDAHLDCPIPRTSSTRNLSPRLSPTVFARQNTRTQIRSGGTSPDSTHNGFTCFSHTMPLLALLDPG